MDAIQDSRDSPARPATKAARILLLDDNEIARAGLRSLLESRPDWEIVGEARAGREAMELLSRLQPDLVVIDPGREPDALELVREIVNHSLGIEVLVLTSHASEDRLRMVFETGAHGYLLKSDAGRHLVSAIEAVRRGTRYGVPKETRFEARATGRRLSPREREIVQLLAQGMTNKEVASTLRISVKTAETHRSNIMRKLDLHSVSGLVRYALRNHMIEA
jgi:DNA-binding NarL/FixJ family response regulator